MFWGVGTRRYWACPLYEITQVIVLDSPTARGLWERMLAVDGEHLPPPNRIGPKGRRVRPVPLIQPVQQPRTGSGIPAP